jgi:hypothetical protein
MPGERFSALYARPGAPAQDSGRARHRVGALFGETVFSQQTDRLAVFLGRELGVPVPGDGRYSSHWHQFFRECRTPEFLDAVTLIYRYLYWHVGDGTANWWRDVVKEIFAEENLAYQIDDVGGIHPAVDREFQRNVVSAVAALQSQRYLKVRNMFEIASNHLSTDPPNYKQAWRGTVAAVGAMFGLMFPYARLSVDEIDRRLRPLVRRVYDGDAAAQSAAQRMLLGFQEWVEASDLYRHHPGAAEHAEPPADIAILAISQGASLLRWLAGLDEGRGE